MNKIRAGRLNIHPPIQDLEEMGFKKIQSGNEHYYDRTLFDIEQVGLDYCYHSDGLTYYPNTDTWVFESQIFPTCKEEVVIFISLFQQ